METMEFLPLGSVIRLKTLPKKVMIIARGLLNEQKGEQLFFDYAGVPYPEGVTCDKLVYFNHANVGEVLFSGYDDDANKAQCDLLVQLVRAHPELKRLKPAPADLWK